MSFDFFLRQLYTIATSSQPDRDLQWSHHLSLDSNIPRCVFAFLLRLGKRILLWGGGLSLWMCLSVSIYSKFELTLKRPGALSWTCYVTSVTSSHPQRPFPELSQFACHFLQLTCWVLFPCLWVFPSSLWIWLWNDLLFLCQPICSSLAVIQIQEVLPLVQFSRLASIPKCISPQQVSLGPHVFNSESMIYTDFPVIFNSSYCFL